MSDFRACRTCHEVHDVSAPCAPAPALLALDDVALCELSDPEWDIDGVTQQGSLEVCFGPSDAGKSTLLAERACCLATGQPWLGMNVRRSGRVLVLVFEGLHAFKKKIRAWKAMHGYAVDEPIGVYVVEEHVNFLDGTEVFRLAGLVEHHGVHEVIVDTLAQSICADEENEPMQQAVNNAAYLRRRTGARVVFIHHSGKNRKRGARGGTALTAAADTVLSLDEERDGHVLRCVRQRDGARFHPVFLRLTPTPDGSTVLFERKAEGPAMSLLSKETMEGLKLRNAILAYLREHPAVNTSQIIYGLQKRRQDVIKTLCELMKEGCIGMESKGQAKLWTALS